MCLLACAWKAHPDWPLVLLGNRDEIHARPTDALARWPDQPRIRAGRDRQAGGTWMGLADGPRAAVVTNVRDPCLPTDGASRGLLVSDFLLTDDDACAWAAHIHSKAADYRPFNLLLFDADSAAYVGNQPQPHQEHITPGIHGLSNADFNTPWPKTRRLQERLQAWVDRGDNDFQPLWNALADDSRWPDDVLPDTGIGIELERQPSAAFIRGEHYGTRASTIITIGHDGHARISERSFGPNGVMQAEKHLQVPA